MSENPDAIRSEIEETRRRLGTNVDAVADKVTPSHVVRRQTEKVKDAVFGVKENVMGAADELADGGRSAIDDAGAAIGDVPHRLAGKTQGSPLAAGLIAFGAGLLVASLIPASDKEKKAAAALKEAAEPLTTELSAAAQDVARDLQEPAQEALDNVKSAATEAVENVKEESQTAVSDVTDSTTAARGRIRPA
jgi:gas vesicle protein